MRKFIITRKAIIPIFITFILAIGYITLSTRAARSWYVKKTGGSDTNDCLSPITACETINGALDKASPGNTIYITAETYTGIGTEVVKITKSSTLSGGWNLDFSDQIGFTTIDGRNSRRGIRIFFFGGSIIERFIVEHGSSDGAPGILAESWLEMDECIIRYNTDIGDYMSEGGGIRTGPARLYIEDSLIHNNTSSTGAGIFIGGGSVVLRNTTISGNIASKFGGGITNRGGSLTTNNVTITNNIADDGGGGIHNEAGGRVTLENSILAGNSSGWANDCGGTIGTLGYNLIGDDSNCTFTPATGDWVNIDSNLEPLADNGGPTQTHELLGISPAIHSANDLSCESTDQRGVSRPQGLHCDIGAFEKDSSAGNDGDSDTKFSFYLLQANAE